MNTNNNSNNLQLDGWKFEIIIDKLKFNITEEIKKYINKNNVLKISNESNLRKLIDIADTHKAYYIKISNKYKVNWKSITIGEKTGFELDLQKSLKNKPAIKIVYFINSEISNCYLKLMNDQLKDLIRSKILSYENVFLYFIVISSNEYKKKEIKNLIN